MARAVGVRDGDEKAAPPAAPGAGSADGDGGASPNAKEARVCDERQRDAARAASCSISSRCCANDLARGERGPGETGEWITRAVMLFCVVGRAD